MWKYRIMHCLPSAKNLLHKQGNTVGYGTNVPIEVSPKM